MKKITGIFTFICLLILFGCQKESSYKEADQLNTPSAKKPGPSPPPSIVGWQACFGTSSDDQGNDVAISGDGSVFIVGTINNLGAGYIMKLNNSDHKPAWEQPAIIDGNGRDEIFAVVATPDGGCMVTGLTYSADIDGYVGGADVLLAKVSSAGSIEWKLALGTPADEKANDIILTTDNGYALTGYSNDNLLVLKLKSTANTTSADIVDWQQQYAIPDYKGNSGYAITERDGNYVVAGRTLTIADVTTRPLFARISASDGTAQQIKAIENFTGGFARTLTTNHDNTGFVLAGRMGCEALFFSVDQNGNAGWSKTYGGAGCFDMFKAIVKTTGGYLLAGVTNSKNGDIAGAKGGSDVWLFKTGADGTRISSYNLGGKNDDEGNAIVATIGNTYMVVGTTNSTSGDVSGNKGGSDIWAVRVAIP